MRRAPASEVWRVACPVARCRSWTFVCGRAGGAGRGQVSGLTLRRRRGGGARVAELEQNSVSESRVPVCATHCALARTDYGDETVLVRERQESVNTCVKGDSNWLEVRQLFCILGTCTIFSECSNFQPAHRTPAHDTMHFGSAEVSFVFVPQPA